MSNWNQTKEERENEMRIKSQLMDRYPLLYYYARRPDRSHSMNYGLSVGKGWLPLIEEMSAKIEAILNKMVEENPNCNFPRAVQVKEKFGGLRFYTDVSHKEIDDIIADYESKAYEICQECGMLGTLRQQGWHRVLCDLCEQKK